MRHALQDSMHASSQFAAGTALSDTASSVHHTGRLPGGSSIVMSRAPNVAYSRGMVAGPSMLCITGAVKVTVSLGLVGRTTTCMVRGRRIY